MWEPHKIITVLSLSKSHCSSQKVLKETVVVLIFAATVYGLFLFLHTSDANICQKKAELCLHKRSSRTKRADDNKLQVMFPSSLDTSSQALKEEVIGVEGEVVPVFFHVYSVGQTLPCLMRDLSFQGLVDPKFEWIGPNGLISKESQRFVITDNGNLVFDTIYVVDSGNYTCSLMYRLDSKQVTRLVRYTVYVYHNPNKSVRLEADFYATKCNNNEITKFEKHLQKQLEDAVQDLQCEVHHWNSACHSIKPSKTPVSHIFNFQFIVFPFALGWADDCSDPQCDQQSEERVKKCLVLVTRKEETPAARECLVDAVRKDHIFWLLAWNPKGRPPSDFPGDIAYFSPWSIAFSFKIEDHCNKRWAYTRIRSFIEDYPFKRKLQNIDYIANSLNGVKVDHCKPGFGKNVITSNQCEGCCVACPPGHFSARQDTICTPCAFGSFNRHYGKTECTSCPQNEATNRSGATSEQECHWITYQWILPVASTIGTCIFLITIWIICRKYCKTPMKGKYVQVKEEDVKEEVKTLANIIKNVDLLEQKSKLRPSEFIVRHSPKHGVEFSDDQCIGLLSDTDTETCRTLDTSKSDETTCPKSSMEECISPYTSDYSCFTSRSSTPQNLETIFRHGR